MGDYNQGAYPPPVQQTPQPQSQGIDWLGLLSQLSPAHLIPSLLGALVPGASGVMNDISNIQAAHADRSRFIHSLLATNPLYQATLASGANPDNGGLGWSGSPFSIFPEAPGGPGPNLPPEMQQNLAFQVAPGPQHDAYTRTLGQYHAPGMVPQGLPVPVMTEPLARSWLLQTQAAQGGFPGIFPPGVGGTGPGGFPALGWTWDQKNGLRWHGGIPPAAEKQPEAGVGPPEDLSGGAASERLLGGAGAGTAPTRTFFRRQNAGPQAGEAVAPFTDPQTGETVPGGVMTSGSTFRGQNGKDYTFTDQGIMPSPNQGVGTGGASTAPLPAPAPARTPAPAPATPPGPPATPPAVPAAGPAPARAAPTPAPAAGTPPAAPAQNAPAGTPSATAPPNDETLLFGTPPASGTGYASPAPEPSLPPGASFQAAPGTAPGATPAAQPSVVQTQGGGQVEPPDVRKRVAGETITKPQATADQLHDLADATANDPGLQSYLRKTYGTLYPAPSDVLRDPNLTNAAANWKAQRVRDEETFKASLKLNSTDQAQVRRALNAKQNVENNFLAPLGVDKNGVVITPLSASPSPTGAEFTRTTEALRHITGGGPLGSGIRLLGELGHMASPGGVGIIPGMPAEWATVEQMSQRPGVWGLAATRLMAGLSNSVLIARAIGETGRVNQQELNLLQNILIPSASDSEYRNRAKAQLLIGMLDSIAKGLTTQTFGKDGSVANANQQIRDAAMQMDPQRTQAILGAGQQGQGAQPQQPRLMGG